jgi:hypothetical protein
MATGSGGDRTGVAAGVAGAPARVSAVAFPFLTGMGRTAQNYPTPGRTAHGTGKVWSAIPGWRSRYGAGAALKSGCDVDDT